MRGVRSALSAATRLCLVACGTYMPLPRKDPMAIIAKRWQLALGLLLVSLLLASAGQAFAATAEIVAYSRVGERLLVTASGILCLLLGFRLYRTINTNLASADPRDGGVAGGGSIEGTLGTAVNVKLTSSGPGLFFALFGAALLGYVMFSRIDITADDTPGHSHIVFGFPDMTAEQSVDKARAIFGAIRRLQSIQLAGGVKDDTAASIDTLVNSTPNLVDLIFGDGSYAIYQKLLSPDALAAATEKQKKKYADVSAVLNGAI